MAGSRFVEGGAVPSSVSTATHPMQARLLLANRETDSVATVSHDM
jgi:hypothetical protein